MRNDDIAETSSWPKEIIWASNSPDFWNRMFAFSSTEEARKRYSKEDV
ncbi:MAG: hypothetical protein LKM30_01255 [Bacilli bacterium]|nr:hypothetical protein [Bacilli bacterium]